MMLPWREGSCWSTSTSWPLVPPSCWMSWPAHHHPHSRQQQPPVRPAQSTSEWANQGLEHTLNPDHLMLEGFGRTGLQDTECVEGRGQQEGRQQCTLLSSGVCWWHSAGGALWSCGTLLLLLHSVRKAIRGRPVVVQHPVTAGAAANHCPLLVSRRMLCGPACAVLALTYGLLFWEPAPFCLALPGRLLVH